MVDDETARWVEENRLLIWARVESVLSKTVVGAFICPILINILCREGKRFKLRDLPSLFPEMYEEHEIYKNEDEDVNGWFGPMSEESRIVRLMFVRRMRWKVMEAGGMERADVVAESPVPSLES